MWDLKTVILASIMISVIIYQIHWSKLCFANTLIFCSFPIVRGMCLNGLPLNGFKGCLWMVSLKYKAECFLGAFYFAGSLITSPVHSDCLLYITSHIYSFHEYVKLNVFQYSHFPCGALGLFLWFKRIRGKCWWCIISSFCFENHSSPSPPIWMKESFCYSWKRALIPAPEPYFKIKLSGFCQVSLFLVSPRHEN